MSMSDDQMLKLSHSEWGEFFLRDLNAMRLARHMCDAMILLKDGMTLPAHSCVLAAASPLFKSLLSDADYPEIDMAEFPADIIKQVVEFIYTGDILVRRGDVEVLCSIAEALNIPVLTEIIKGVFSSLLQTLSQLQEEELPFPISSMDSCANTPQATPTKRGRGRPRKVLPMIEHTGVPLSQESIDMPVHVRNVKQEKVNTSDDDCDLMLGYEASENLKQEDAATILNSLVNLMADHQSVLSAHSHGDHHYHDVEHSQPRKDKYEIINPQEGIRPVNKRKEWKALQNPVQYEDIKVPADGSVPNRAEQTLPAALILGLSSKDEDVRGVFTVRKLAKGATFGPYEGEVAIDQKVAEDSQYCWRIFKNCKFLHWISGEDESRANWMRFVQVAETPQQQNMEVFQYEGSMYFRSIKVIPPNQELLVRYGNQYSAKLTSDVVCQISVSESQLEGFKCERCEKMYSTDIMYWKHVRAVHGEPMPVEVYNKIQMERDKNLKDRAELKASVKSESHDEDQENRSDPDYSEPPSRQSNRIKTKKNKPHSPNKKGRGRPRKYMDPEYENENNECPVCHRTFKTRAVLRQHSTIHSGEKPWKCDICDKAYTQRGNLQMHMTSHTGERPYVCNICGKDFNRRGELKKHIVRHQGNRPFKCPTCGKGFGDWGNLHRHKITHTGEKPFKCHICGRGFSQGSNLRTHVKRHTGEKPHKCSMCNKCFGDLSHLHTHLRRHTGEKPFTCFYCGKGFVDKQSMKKHAERHIEKQELIPSKQGTQQQVEVNDEQQFQVLTVSEIDDEEYVLLTSLDASTTTNMPPVTVLS